MRRRTALKSIFCGAALGIPSLFSKDGFSPALLDKDEVEPSEQKVMASVAEEFRRKFEVPALSMAVALNGRLAYEQAFGVKDRDTREELTTSNLFRIASVTKPITSVAIFSLIEQGRLRSDDKVFGTDGILGTEYGKRPYGQGVEKIIIDHLLTHTSGGWENDLDDPMFSNPRMDHAELISWTLNNRPLTNPPGKVFAYSNYGYCILGRVIEKISGLSYSDYVRNTVLSPCGITDMQIAGNTLKDRVANEVSYYGRTGQDPYGLNVRRMDSHGGWLATPADLVRFTTHVDSFDTSRNILKPETVQRMTTPSNINPHYARGWWVNEKGHWLHGGNLPGTTAMMVRTASHFCWAALMDTRESERTLNDVVWDIVSKVRAWRAALA